MRITELLKQESIGLNVSVSTKEEAIDKLVDLMAAGFTLEDALPLEQVLQAEDPASLLLGVDAYFAGRPVLILKPAAEKKVRNGMTLVLPDAPPAREYRVYSEAGEFLALSRVSQGKLITIKSFFQV